MNNWVNPDYHHVGFEWPIFPQATYSAQSLINAPMSSRLILPPGSSSLEQWVADETSRFVHEGMRYFVGAVILVHYHSQPRLLLIDVDDGFHQLHKSSLSLSLSYSVHHQSLPLFPYRKWQSPTDVLTEELSRIVQFRKSNSVEDFSEVLGTIQPPPTHQYTNRVADCLSSTSMNLKLSSGNPLGPNADHDVAQSESDRQGNQDETEQKGPDLEEDEENLYGDLLVPAESNSFLKESLVTPSTPVGELLLKDTEPLTTTTENISSNSMHHPIIGAQLGLWWIIEFGNCVLPYLPAHITRPKAQIKLYQVIVPPECDLILPQNSRVKFASFDSLLSFTQFPGLGPAYASIPLTISRFCLRPFVSRTVDTPSIRSTTNSAHISHVDLNRVAHHPEDTQVDQSISITDMSAFENRTSDQQDFVQKMQKLEEDTDESELASL